MWNPSARRTRSRRDSGYAQTADGWRAAVGDVDLGDLAAHGHGWYRLAAEQGHASAQNNLGWMYLKGRGVRQDNTYAHMWLSLAASKGKKNVPY
mgnify:CR=1 FL=1